MRCTNICFGFLSEISADRENWFPGFPWKKWDLYTSKVLEFRGLEAQGLPHSHMYPPSWRETALCLVYSCSCSASGVQVSASLLLGGNQDGSYCVMTGPSSWVFFWGGAGLELIL